MNGTGSPNPTFGPGDATTCPRCGYRNRSDAAFCGGCGTALAGGGPVAPAPPSPPLGSPGPLDPPPAVATVPWARTQNYNIRRREWERTDTGLLLLVIGSLLSWVPYVDLLGDLLLFVGVLMVFLGRWAFDQAHVRAAGVGAGLVVAGTLGAVIAGFVFAGALVDDADTGGATLSQVGAALKTDLAALFVVSLVVGTISRLGQVILVYRLSTPKIRGLLWSGFLTGELIAIATLVYLLPRIESAVTQATSGSTVDLGPINQLTATATLWGLAGIVPAILFAIAYYQIRERERRPAPAGS